MPNSTTKSHDRYDNEGGDCGAVIKALREEAADGESGLRYVSGFGWFGLWIESM